MVYWFNGLMGFHMGKTKPCIKSLVQRQRNTGGGDTLPPIYIYVLYLLIGTNECKGMTGGVSGSLPCILGVKA